MVLGFKVIVTLAFDSDDTKTDRAPLLVSTNIFTNFVTTGQ